MHDVVILTLFGLLVTGALVAKDRCIININSDISYRMGLGLVALPQE